MMTNKQQDKTLQEDQAFIQSLYKQLENSELDNEQPSELLDQRILNAAQKATKSSKEKKANKKNKRSIWLYPVSMAASVLLMVTLVNQQLDTKMQVEYATPLNSTAAPESFSATETVDDTAIKSRSIKEKKSVRAPQPMQLSSVQLEQAERAAEMQQQVAKQAQTKRQLAKPVISELSEQSYLALQRLSAQKPLYWRLKQEEDNSYLIELLLNENSTRYYRLTKQHFQLNNDQPAQAKPFAEIIYLPTNN